MAAVISIKEYLTNKDLTVKELQAKMGFATPNAVYKWLNGDSLPTVDNLVYLAAVLEVKVDDILVVEAA